MGVLKKNWFFIIIAVGMIICFLNRWQPLDAVVAPADTTVWFDVQEGEMCQVWSPDVKWIESISVPYLAEGDFRGTVKLSFENKATGQCLISQNVLLDCKAGEQGKIDVAFNHLSVDPTSQYAFRMEYDEVTEGKGLFLYGCEKYAGGEIGGEDIGFGISIRVLFVKYNLLFFAAFMLFVLFSFGVFFMLLWDKRFEETVGLGVLNIGFVLYVFGLFGYLETGVHLVTFLSVMAFVGAIYLYNKKKMTLSELFCPSMVILVVIFGALMIYNRGIWYERFDEYSHWGTAVKDMFYFNAMSRHPLTTVKSSDYPPFATLLEYFFTYWNGLFSEPITYVGYQISMMSILAVCWKTRKKNAVYLIPLVVATILVPVMFINYTFCTIYADSILGAFMVYLMVCWIQEDMNGFNVYRISLGLIALTLTKRFGLYFALVFVIVLMCDTILERRKLSQWLSIAWFLEIILLSYISFIRYARLDDTVGRLKWRDVSDIAVVLAVQIFGLLTWFLLKNKQDNAHTVRKPLLSGIISGKKHLFRWLMVGLFLISIAFLAIYQFIASKSILGMLYEHLLKVEFDNQQKLLCMRFFKDMWTENTWLFGWYGVSYLGLVTVLQIVCIIVWMVLKRGRYDSNILKRSVLLTIGALGYGTIVFASRIRLYNLFGGTFDDYHDKYLGSYGIVIILFFLVLFLQNVERYEAGIEHQRGNHLSFRFKKTIISLVICGFVIGSTPLNSFVIKNTGFGYNSEFMLPFDDIEKMTQSTAKAGDRVYYITNNGLGDNLHVFEETVSPWLRVADYRSGGMCASEEKYMEYVSNHPEMYRDDISYKTEEEFSQELRDYQYVFIMRSEDYFIESYQNIFEDPESIENGSFYQVKYDEAGNIYLKLIGKVGVLIC